MPNQNQSLSAEALTRICEVVDRFDAAWHTVAKGGAPPWIEDALRGRVPAERPVYLRNLLTVELECRVAFGEQPTVNEYLKRFPKDAELVADVFLEFEHSQAGETLDEDSVSEEVEDTKTPEWKSRPTQSPGTAEFQPGDVLHDYQLLEQLGQGGMGTVFKARHSRLMKTVALKVLAPERLRDPGAVARFQREMEAVGQLRDLHVVEAYDAGEARGIHYLVMEYVEGLDAATILRQRGSGSPPASATELSADNSPVEPRPSGSETGKPLPDGRGSAELLRVTDACEIIRQAARGLHHAHQRGLIHRDIKPSNLMVSAEGIVKVLDLGLARLHAEHPAGNLTSTGNVMGTVDYIAPEQILDSHKVDLRADLYSLGCTFYSLLAGEPPFAGPSYSSAYLKMKAHENTTPPYIPRADIPGEVLAILDKLLRKQPAERFASAAEVVTALAPFTAGHDLVRLVGFVVGHRHDETAALGRHPTSAFTTEVEARPREGLPIRRSMSPQRFRRIITPFVSLMIVAVLGSWLLQGVVRSKFKIGGNSVLSDSKTSTPPILNFERTTLTERAAAEWALSVGGQVAVQQDGEPRSVSRLADLPPGVFQVVEVRLADNVTDAGLQNLRGLSSLSRVFLPNPSRVTPKGIEIVASLPNLKTLILECQGFTDDHIHTLRDCRSLEHLSVGHFALGTDASAETLAQLPKLKTLKPSHWPMTESGLRRLLAAPKLSDIDLGGSRVTDAGLQLLADDPRWVGLGIDSPQTAQGFRNLGRLPNLAGLKLTVATIPDTTFDSARFPKLRAVSVENGHDNRELTADHVARIARLHQIELLQLAYLRCEEVPGLDELAKLDRLKEIEFQTTPLTDDGLAHLAALPALELIRLNHTKVTPAGLAKFNAARPDVKVEGDVAALATTAKRAAAEWVLSVGGSVAVQIGGQRIQVEQTDKLPAGSFRVVAITMITPRDFTRDGMNCMKGLVDLEYIELAEVPGLTNEWLEPLRGLPKLRHIKVSTVGAGRITNEVIPLLKTLPCLQEIHFIDGQLTDADFAQLATLPGLLQINFECRELTDVAVEHFVKSQIRNLALMGGETTRLTPHSVELAAQFPELSYLHVSPGLLTDQSVEALRSRSTLKWMRVGPGNDETVRRLSRLTQLERLDLAVDLESKQITDDGLASLKSLVRLEFLNCEHLVISDAALEHIAAITSLKEFRFRNTQFTPAGLAKFKAARPDVRVEGDVAALDPAAERSAAEWVLNRGEEVSVRVDGQDRYVRTLAELPTGPFVVTWVVLRKVEPISEEGMQRLSKLSQLEDLCRGVARSKFKIGGSGRLGALPTTTPANFEF